MFPEFLQWTMESMPTVTVAQSMIRSISSPKNSDTSLHLVQIEMKAFDALLASSVVQEYLTKFRACRPQLAKNGAVSFDESPILPKLYGRLLGNRSEPKFDGSSRFSVNGFAVCSSNNDVSSVYATLFNI